MRNVDDSIATWLRSIGVATIEQLRTNGAVKTYAQLKKAGLFPRIGLLWELYAGLHNLPPTALSANEKHQLLRELAAADKTVRIQ